MTTRREWLIAAACVGAAGAANGRMSLLRSATLSAVTPSQFGAWAANDVSDLVAPAAPGTLMARLYAETVERVYRNAVTGAEVMMLLAYGDSQTNELQVHRPEQCYPAFGFELSDNRPTQVAIGGGVTLPGRQLVADAPGRREVIVYWARLGEYLPIDLREQRVDRLRTSMAGEIADGLIARFSVLSGDTADAVGVLEGFIAGLVRATAAKARPALIGSLRARAMAAKGF